MFLGVTGMIRRMPYTDEQRRQIGRAVSRKRMDAGLDKEDVSGRAKMSSITWKRVEDGDPVRDSSLGKVLRVIGVDLDEVLSDDQVDSRPAVFLDEASDDDLVKELAKRLAEGRGGRVRRTATDEVQNFPPGGTPPGWRLPPSEKPRMLRDEDGSDRDEGIGR